LTSNAGVTQLTAGTGIVLNGNTGKYYYKLQPVAGTGAGGTVTSIGVVGASSKRKSRIDRPSSIYGTITLDLSTTGVTATDRNFRRNSLYRW
jgi:hypothetical protein